MTGSVLAPQKGECGGGRAVLKHTTREIIKNKVYGQNSVDHSLAVGLVGEGTVADPTLSYMLERL